MSSTASGWDWIRRSAVSPREFTCGGLRTLKISKAPSIKSVNDTESHFCPIDLVSKSGQISLKALVFTLQSLDAGQVVTVVVSVESLVLLLDPLFSFICISGEEQTEESPMKSPFSALVW